MNELYPNMDQLDDILKAGNSALNLQLGIVSKIDGERYEIVAIDDISSEFKVGDILKTNETHCREIVSKRKTIALTRYRNISDLQRHPLYSVNTLKAYIGAPIIAGNDIWGTVNFSSMKIRDLEFSNGEISMVNSFAGLISENLFF